MDLELRALGKKDLGEVKKILKYWVRNSEILDRVEYDEYLSHIHEFLDETVSFYFYYVLLVDGKIIGFSGIKKGRIDEDYEIKGENVGELNPLFLNDFYRSRGYGRVFLNKIFEKAKSLGLTKLIWNSGPRYKETAWGFYEHVVGKEKFIIENKYGLGRNAKVWVKEL